MPGESLDGMYTMETFVHATEPEAVLAGFYGVLRPGGRIALFEYDHEFPDESSEEMAESMRKINKLFLVLGIMPYLFVRLFGLESHFINAEAYGGHGRWRFVAISASKAGGQE
ncbi:hypothetical protein B0T21DRAFT_408824 [Apiosordaria backusii]|uniref:Methyltransferase type 11 domain-containing protein n=1 Tax=Apiosordaria backusii TaxID=314023 RepID=A0AA40EMC6_9PEZI|nr:hypothetical protein B0T21DRAFT_408824 [Apiosordaria backusii]